MTDDRIKFDLTAEFVTAHTLPTLTELAYGFDHGWLRESEVVGIAEHELASGVALAPSGEELALLLRDDYTRVADVLSNVEADGGQAWRLWLYLALAWLSENRDQFEDPYEAIESLYADFGYPDEIAGLVRFMPARAGEASGLGAIDRRWAAYLEERARTYDQ